MPAAAVPLAKLTRPRVGKALARERLFSTLDHLRDKPVVWIAAQPGAGKTTLLASFLEARKLKGLWYQVDPGDADPASFFYHLGLAAQSLPRGHPAPPLPLLTPEYLADVPGFARRFFRSLYQRMGAKSALVLDNLQEAPEDSPLHKVLATGFEEMPEGVGAFVASRSAPSAIYAPLLARSRLGLIEAADMRLTLEETGAIAGARSELDEAEVRSLHERSGGWAAGVTLLMERAGRGESVEGADSAEALHHVFAHFAERLIEDDFAHDLDTLLELGFLPRVTPAMARALTGGPAAEALLEKLHRRNLFTERRRSGHDVTYQFHHLMQAFLREKARSAWAPERWRAAAARAAEVLQANGAPEDAIPLLRDIGDWEGLARVVMERAQDLISQGRHRTLRDWIALLPEALKEAQPRVRYWQGAALSTHAPRASRDEFRRAHAGFAREGNALGRVLSAAGVVYSYYLDLAQLNEMDPWIAELNAAMDAGAPFPTPALELHVQAALLFALGFRHPERGRVERCAARMFELLEDPGIGPNEKVAAAAILLFDCYHHSNIDSGTRLVSMIQPLVEAPGPTAAVRALWWIQVGYWGCTAGDIPAAIRGFEASMRTCAENGLSIPLIEVYAQMGLAFAALFSGDLARADAHRVRAEQHWKSFRRIDVSASAMFKGVFSSHRGDFEAARAFAREHYEIAAEEGIQWQAHNALLHQAFVAAEQGRLDDVAEFNRRGRELVKGSVFERFTYQGAIIEAYGHLRRGDRVAMRASLAAALVAGRDERPKFFLRLQPNLLARVYAAALEEGIEVDLVRRSIRELRIAPPSADVPGWPWPLEVRTLGRFEVLRDGRPLEFSRKAPRKTLQLLKAIIAGGGANVPEAWLLEALWPDEEGDAASKSLGAAVLRLRGLLGDADAVIQQAGTLSLDRSRAWVDVWAFEAGARPGLYQGSFLAEEEGVPWPVPMRERLRARFIQKVGEEGAALEKAGRHEAAIDLYMRGLDADSIVEPFYQGLMRCYAHLDRRAEGVSAYRRLKQILSVTLGLPPSATTERLYKSLKLESVGHK